MGSLRLQVGWQVYNGDGIEGTLLDTDTTSHTQGFADEGDLIGGGHLNTELPCLYYRTRFSTFLFALFRLALVGGDNGDSGAFERGFGACFGGFSSPFY